VDSICLLCDCLEHGTQALFNQISAQAGSKFMEIVKMNLTSEGEMKNDLLQSAIFGLGLIAQKQPRGQFGFLAELVAILQNVIKQEVAADLAEDEKESLLYLKDNSVSALTKLVLFQYDGGNVISDDLVNALLTQVHPLKTDLDEAQDINCLVMSEVLGGQNEVIKKFGEGFKAMITRVKEYAVAN
jgi:hypothetical protein